MIEAALRILKLGCISADRMEVCAGRRHGRCGGAKPAATKGAWPRNRGADAAGRARGVVTGTSAALQLLLYPPALFYHLSDLPRWPQFRRWAPRRGRWPWTTLARLRRRLSSPRQKLGSELGDARDVIPRLRHLLMHSCHLFLHLLLHFVVKDWVDMLNK